MAGCYGYVLVGRAGPLIELTGIDKQPVSFTVGARYWAESPENGPVGWGFRGVVTLLFPEIEDCEC